MSHKIERKGSAKNTSRRQLLSMLGVGSAVALAGCGGSADDGGDDASGGTGDDGSGDDGSGDDGGIDQDQDVDEFPDRADSYDTNTSASFSTLNPLYNSEAGAGVAIGRALHQGYTFDANNELFPLIYDLETDTGEVWVFSLRENLEFSDPYGQVTAEDFVYQIQELHQGGWANTVSGPDWGGVNVVQNSELEFQAELENPQLLWPETFDPLEYPIPKDLVEPYAETEDVEGLQENQELLELEFTGNLGPYTLDSWDRGSGTNYSRNENYFLRDVEAGPDLFQEAPYFEGASIDVVEEQSSRLAQLETGEVDASAIPPEQFQSYNDDPNVDVKQIPQPYNEIAAVNMRDNGWTGGPGNLFQYKEFRQAMAAAIDKEELIAGVMRGLAEPHFTWQPEWTEWYPDESGFTNWGVGDNEGEELARQLAEDAFARSDYDYEFDGDDLVTPDGDQVELQAYHSSGQETEQLTTEFVADSLGEKLGIEVEVNAIDGTRFNEDFWNMPAEGGSDTIQGEEVVWGDPAEGADLAPTQWNGGPRSVTSSEGWDISLVFGLNTYPRNPLNNSVFFDGLAGGFYNPVGYYAEDYDPREMFQQARQADGREQLTEAMGDLFVNLAEEQPYIMLFFDDDLTGYNPDLAGPIENFSNGWDFPTWHIDG